MLRNDLGELGYGWGDDYDGEPCLMESPRNDGAPQNKMVPITKCNKRLLNGSDESVINFYVMVLTMTKGGDTASNMALLGADAPAPQSAEPAYARDGRFDANAACWLLYSDVTFFLPHEISWDGEHHRPAGMQVNATKMGEVPVLLANLNVLNGMLDLLMELDKDEALRVPLRMIDPALHDALRNEDMTGLTLFNLQACAQALMIKETAEDEYQVICDNRLTAGIPSFYQLVSRMVWDMRDYNQRVGSFKVTFVNARNIDADQVLGQMGGPVPGAFSQPIWQVTVTQRPAVELPDPDEVEAHIRESSRVFASGFDDPVDIQADEDLFEATLNELAREFPLTQDIEGTHVLGRIPRIEHVKVGDPLVLGADWQSEYFDPVCIEVFNEKGETLGNLRERFSPTLSGNRELACLLPHVTATVETVTPKSKRRKNAKYALMDVRMELDPGVLGPDGNLLPDVIRDAKALLALPRGERVVVSKGGIVASQLSGNIRVDEAHDVPNPLGETFRLWDVESDDMPAVESVPELETSQTVPEPREVPQQTFDTGRWTFDRHQLVQARRFCIEVPDQWEPGRDDSGRVLGSYVQGVEDDSEYPQILCNSMIGDLDEEAQKLWRETGIPEVHLQMQRKAIYSNDMTNKIMRSINDWVVPGKNCKVLVFEHRNPSLFPDMFPDSYEYHVKPLAYDHEDFMRLADPYEHLGDGELKALAFAVAATVELDVPVELRRPAELERYCEGPADADAFCETVTVIANMLNMSGSDRMTANLYQAVRRADNDMQVLLMGDTMPLIQAEAFNESLHDEVHYFGRIVQALEKQAELGTDGFERMWKLAGEFGEGRVVDHVTMSDNKEDEAKINALGVIKIPAEYQALHERWEALRPGPDGKPGRPLGTAATREASDTVREAGAQQDADEESARKWAKARAAQRKAEEAQRRAEEAHRKAEEAERRRAEQVAHRLTMLNLTRTIEEYSSKSNDGFCSVATLCDAFEATSTSSQVEEMLDQACHRRLVRKKILPSGVFYAPAWSPESWVEARDKENRRLLAAREAREAARKRERDNEINEEIARLRTEIGRVEGEAKRADEVVGATAGMVSSAESALTQARTAFVDAQEMVDVISNELSKLGFFAFGEKRRLRAKLEEAQSHLAKTEQEKERAEGRRSTALAEQGKRQRSASRKREELRQLRANVDRLKRSLRDPLEPLPIDAKERIRAFMELWGCPVTPAWCVGNVPGIDDEKTALEGLHKLACDLDVYVPENEGGDYELTGPQSFERDIRVMGIQGTNGRVIPLGVARREHLRLVAEVYKKMPIGGKGVDKWWVVHNCPEITTSQKAAAIMRVGVETGYIEKIDGTGSETLYRRLEKRRTPEEERAAARTRAVSKARQNNERLAREIHKRANSTPVRITPQWISSLNMPEITTTQKAAAVLRVAVELGLFEKTVERQGESSIVLYHKKFGK